MSIKLRGCHQKLLIFSILTTSGVYIASRSTETKLFPEIHNNENKLVESGISKFLKYFQNNFGYQTMSNQTSANDLQTNLANKTNSFNISSIFEEKYNDYSYCQVENVDENKNWSGHFLTSKMNKSKYNFLPKNDEETPINAPPLIPKHFLIEESDYCKKRSRIKAIAYVHSAINNVERRNATRRTWGNATEDIGLVFVMGISKNKEEESIVSNESQLHHDIVQGNYTDIYRLLVYKALNGMFWVTKNCGHVQWVIHADDDVVLDTKKYLQFIKVYEREKSKKIICSRVHCGIAGPVRDKKNKWYVSENEYPYDRYPIYCFGDLWYTSMEVIKLLIEAVPYVKYLGIDDIYVTGLLAEKAGITRYHKPSII